MPYFQYGDEHLDQRPVPARRRSGPGHLRRARAVIGLLRDSKLEPGRIGRGMPTSPESRVLHIDITGHDKAGVTHSLTSILAGSKARILDIGQAVIHDALALGLLVEFTEELKSSPLLTQLLLKAH